MKTYFLTLILCAVVLPLFSQQDSTKTQAVSSAIYTCPMHPEIALSMPGKCPKCGMDLVQKTSTTAEHKMEMMMCPMHGMVDMNHKHDKGKGDNHKMTKGMGVAMGAMMLILIIIAGSR